MKVGSSHFTGPSNPDWTFQKDKLWVCTQLFVAHVLSHEIPMKFPCLSFLNIFVAYGNKCYKKTISWLNKLFHWRSSLLILLDLGDDVKSVTLGTRFLTRFLHISLCGPSWYHFRTKVLSHLFEIYISSLAYIQLWPHQCFLHKAPRIAHPT